MIGRREVLAGLVLTAFVRPASATPERMAAAIAAFSGNATPKPGRIHLEIAKLIDNGNTVPITVTVESPMSAADHVTDIAIFNERNPETEVIRCMLGPRAGKAEVSTRIRLATSQKLVAIARMNDGSCWTHTVDVIVALAACLEGEAP
ncbi:SoxY-related AACIE arm protein [Massilia endophytica]|uniref:SoxY-related AACIE arm protein n=1 Tax=Massilia endophytica TaxID=2899220 RepID=UPI001E31BDD9|nr:SoxY-related AACIE arm protein [Massilia endophytica]UGQ46632.1 SoxY-related AACIE arm protein [Massilia endophytica]